MAPDSLMTDFMNEKSLFSAYYKQGYETPGKQQQPGHDEQIWQEHELLKCNFSKYLAYYLL